MQTLFSFIFCVLIVAWAYRLTGTWGGVISLFILLTLSSGIHTTAVCWEDPSNALCGNQASKLTPAIPTEEVPIQVTFLFLMLWASNIVTGILPAVIAARKGYRWFLWTMTGLNGLIVILFLPPVSQAQQYLKAAQRRKGDLIAAVLSCFIIILGFLIAKTTVKN